VALRTQRSLSASSQRRPRRGHATRNLRQPCAFPVADRPAVAGRPRDRRLEPEDVRPALAPARPDADARLRHRRGRDHPGGDRPRRRRRLPARHERVGTRPWQTCLHLSDGRDERPLECLLRLQRERLPARLRAFDGGIPQGVLPDLPDHARRTDGERGPATARAASSRHGRPRHPFVQVVWNPQGYGSPDVPGNSAQAYYPATGTWTSSTTISTTSAAGRSGRLRRRCTRLIRASPSRSLSGASGNLRSRFRPAHGEVPEDASSHRADLVLQRQAGVDLRSRVETIVTRGIPALHRPARLTAARPGWTRPVSDTGKSACHPATIRRRRRTSPRLIPSVRLARLRAARAGRGTASS
jgi:hypothetical protein